MTALNDSALLGAYTKPYRGFAWRHRRSKRKVRFYDEREWRYVPVARELKSLLLGWPDYARSAEMDARHELFSRNYALPITPDDITYLIVPYKRDERHLLHLAEYVSKLYKRVSAQVAVTTAIMTDDCLKGDV
jgi:hypothetical protein